MIVNMLVSNKEKFQSIFTCVKLLDVMKSLVQFKARIIQTGSVVRLE